MPGLSELYQNVILEHNRSPRNYRAMSDADGRAEGHNPLCGDQVTVWVRMDGDVIGDVTFQGAGCAISRASASLMTAAVKGKSIGTTIKIRFFAYQPNYYVASPGEVIRVVNIEGIDQQADGGTHVANTREVGQVHITGSENKGKGNKRLEIVLK